MPDKQNLINRLTQDLLGPLEEQELLGYYPSDVYLTGILFPQKSDIAPEDSDQLQAEGGVGNETNDTSKDEVSLATVKRPASAGISFVVESNEVPVINITVHGAVYFLDEAAAVITEKGGEQIEKFSWRRKAIKANLDFYLSKAGLIDKTRAPKYKDKSIKRNTYLPPKVKLGKRKRKGFFWKLRKRIKGKDY